MNHILSSAIREKRLIHFRSQGSARLAEPFAYGRGGYGNEVLLCYQLEGGGKNGRGTGWQYLDVGEMEEICMLDKKIPFVRADYPRGSKGLRVVFVQI